MSPAADVEATLKSARRAFRAGDHDKAAELFAAVTVADPDSAAGHQGCATVCFLLKDYDNAVIHFNRLTQLQPRDAKGFVNLGAVYNRIGEYKKAADALRKGIQKDAKSSEAYYNLAIAHRHLNELKMAVNAYREAIRLDPEMAAAHQNLANVMLEMGKNKEAIQHYKRALDIRPDFERARQGLANAESAVAVAKQEANPFGRLVDEETLRKNAAQPVKRELSPLQRERDRGLVDETSTDAIGAAEDFLIHLRDELEPTLQTLIRTVTEGGMDGSTEIYPAHEAFRESLERATAMRTRLQRKMQDLDEHENMMNSSDQSQL